MPEEFPPLKQTWLEKERCEEEDHGYEDYSDPGFDGGSKHLTEKKKLFCSGGTEKDRRENKMSSRGSENLCTPFLI
jgi:hypothetical protein